MAKYEFKKGDRVRRINSHLDGSIRIGDIGVVEIDKYTYYGRSYLDVIMEKDNHKATGYVENFELVEPSCKFKVGDVVRRVKKDQFIGCPPMKVGDTGVIIGMNKDGGYFVGGFPIGNFEGCLELVEETSPTETLTNDKMDFEEIKTFNPESLAEGKKQAEDEKSTFEAQEAKKMYVSLTNQKEEQERIVKVAQEKLKEITEKLKIFNIKKK